MDSLIVIIGEREKKSIERYPSRYDDSNLKSDRESDRRGRGGGEVSRKAKNLTTISRATSLPRFVSHVTKKKKKKKKKEKKGRSKGEVEIKVEERNKIKRGRGDDIFCRVCSDLSPSPLPSPSLLAELGCRPLLPLAVSSGNTSSLL